MIKYPTFLSSIFDSLIENGSEPIIVGGFVRDVYIGYTSKDIDIEVYNIDSYDELKNILTKFGNINIIGKSFGVCKLSIYENGINYDIDFSLPRLDNKIQSGHKGFNIKVDTNLDYKTASSRRDFTMNTIGYSIKHKKILDPYNGIDDLKSCILKAVNLDTFADDPLRVLRCVVFSSRFNLKIEKNLFSLCKKMMKKNMLFELPKERVFIEINKLLLKSKKPSIGLNSLKKMGGARYFLELKNIKEWKEKIKAIDKLCEQKFNDDKTKLIQIISLLFLDLNEIQIKNQILKISNDKKLLETVLKITRYIDYFKNQNIINNFKLYHLATKVKIIDLITINKAIYTVKNNKKELQKLEKYLKISKKLNILNNQLIPIIQGKDLLKYFLKPSKEFKTILDFAYEAQMNEKFTNKQEAQVWLHKYLKDTSKI